jgi:predicted permease
VIATAILEVVFPVFVLATVGWLWVKRGADFDIAFVTRLALEFSIPCLVFGKMAGTRFEADIFWALAASTTLMHFALALILWLVLRVLSMPPRDFLLPLVSANSGNVGLPLCLFAFGEAGLVYAIVIFATTVILQFTLGLWYVSGEASPLRLLRNPMVLGAIFGTLSSWAQIDLPGFVDNALALAGQPAIPLMLLALGASMAGLPLVFPARAITLSALKLMLAGGLAVLIGRLAGLEGTALDVLILQSVMPVAVTTYMLAERYDRDPAAVAQLVMVSTLMVALVLPLILLLLL